MDYYTCRNEDLYAYVREAYTEYQEHVEECEYNDLDE